MNDLSLALPRAARPPHWPAPDALGFGQYLGRYVVASAHDGERWSELAVLDHDALGVPVASGAVQYALAVFEGLKAYRDPAGAVQLFRPRAHARRLAASAARLALPVLDEDSFLRSCALAVRVHEALVPPHGRGALYLRPTLYADEESLGLRPAACHHYAVAVTACADPPLKHLRLWAEPELIRAAPGGLGAVKTGANYAAGIGGLVRARARGYDDVCWCDAAEHRHLGEAGTMNLFVEIDGRLATPPLDGTILAGVTRDSLIALARAEGVEVAERPLSLDALERAMDRGRLGAAFGCGTAARIALIDEIGNDACTLRFGDQRLALRLAERLKAVQEGVIAAPEGWLLAPRP